MKASTAQNEMTHHAVTVGPDDDLYHAFSIMRRCNFRHLPVVDRGELIGILSDRDIFRSGLMRSGEVVIGSQRVRDAMTRGAWTCKMGDRVGDIANQMLLHKIDALPVISEEGKILGIVTSTDLLSCLRRTTGVLDEGSWMAAKISATGDL